MTTTIILYDHRAITDPATSTVLGLCDHVDDAQGACDALAVSVVAYRYDVEGTTLVRPQQVGLYHPRAVDVAVADRCDACAHHRAVANAAKMELAAVLTAVRACARQRDEAVRQLSTLRENIRAILSVSP